MIGRIVIIAIITRRMNNQDILSFCISNGIIHNCFIRRKWFGETQIDHPGSVINRIPYGIRHVLIPFIATGGSSNKRHDEHIIGNSIYSCPVFIPGPDNAGNMGAMTEIRTEFHKRASIVALIRIRRIISDKITGVIMNIVRKFQFD